MTIQPSTPKLVALLDQRDHLQIVISLAADEPSVNVERVAKLSALLALVDRHIVEERKKLGSGAPKWPEGSR